MGEYDINYYLTIQPVEWYYTIVASMIWTGLWLFAALYLTGRSILGLPAYLSGERTVREAMQRSWSLAKSRTIRLLKLISFSVGTWIVARLLLDAILLISATYLIEWVVSVTDSLRFIALVIGVYVSVSFLTGAIIGFLGFSFVSTVLTKYYYEDSELFAVAVQPPGGKELSARFSSKLNRWLQPLRIIPAGLILIGGSAITSGLILNQISELRELTTAERLLLRFRAFLVEDEE